MSTRVGCLRRGLCRIFRLIAGFACGSRECLLCALRGVDRGVTVGRVCRRQLFCGLLEEYRMREGKEKKEKRKRRERKE